MLKRILTWDFLASIFLFTFTFIVYVITLSRSVYYGDSGEFIAVAKTLGIAHPPGYPLYTMLAHLFTYLPFGNLAFRVNLFSAVTSSLTIVVIYFVCLKLTKNRLASASASLILAFSYLFWLYSLVAEVFSLNNLFVAIIILVSLYIFENPKNIKLYYLLSFVFGLALTNHHTIVLLVPALLFLILSTNPKFLLQPKLLIISSLFFLIGLLPYLYLPIRASHNPPLIWGDQTSLGGFFHHVLRRDYGTFSFGASNISKPFNIEVLIFYFSSLFWHFVVIGVVFAVLGIIFVFKEKRLFFFLLLCFLFLGPTFGFLSRLNITGNIDAAGALERFFLTSNLVFALWMSLGIKFVSHLLPKFLKPLTILFSLLFFVPLIFNFQKVNQSHNFIYEDFGRKTFETLPYNSVIFIFGDRLSMISQYLQITENERPDLKFINITFVTDNWYKSYLKRLYPDFNFPYDAFQPLKLSELEAGEIICKELLGKYPVFIENRTDNFDPRNNKYCTNRLYKNLWKLEPKDYQTTPEYLIDQYETFWKPQIFTLSAQKPYDLRTRAIPFYSYSQPLTYLGVFLDENFGKKEKAWQIYDEAFVISPDNAIALYLTARRHLTQKDFENAEKIEKQSIKIDPTQAEPYKILGLISFDVKQNKKEALSYLKRYLKYADEGKEKEEIKKLVRKLEAN